MVTVTTVPTRAALAALNPATDPTVELSESGRSGTFIWRAGNFSAQVSSDPLQGLYVPRSSDTTGSTGAWVRVWDGINGYPEWWGAQPNSGTADCLPALQACVALCTQTNLARADYWTNDTWTVASSYRKIIGQGCNSYDTGEGTRIICKDAAKDVMFVGLASNPGSPSQYLRQTQIWDLQLQHSSAIIPPAAGSDYNGPAGLRTAYVYECEFRNVAGWECSIGFAIYGNVTTRYLDCIAFRSLAGSRSANDIWRGFWLKGSPPVLAGGNASVHLVRCNASRGGSPALTDPVGFKLEGAFVDSFLSWCETSQIPVGMHITGTGATGGNGSNFDLHISHPIIDQASDCGIKLENLAPSALVDIDHPYIACSASAFAAIYIFNGAGRTSIVGGQAIGAGGTTLGVYGLNQRGLTVSALKLFNLARPVGLGACLNCRIQPEIHNPDFSANPYQGAVWLSDCDRMIIQPSVSGKAGAFPQGVYLAGTGNGHVQIDPTLVEPGCISGGVANKVQINGASITVPGVVGTHYVTGVLS
jgi:hypothetical protein